MSGHSHWSTIKYKKAAADAKRGKLFSKLARAISAAARQGGDPNFNARLRSAIDQARAAGLPKDNIERAVKRGSGGAGGEELTEVTYEAYGPGGVAMLIDCITDNANRTLPEVRKIVEQYGGKTGSAGTVAWLFKRKGLFSVSKDAVDEDSIMMLALDAGAEDVRVEGDVYEIITPMDAFGAVREALVGAGLAPSVAELSYIADNELEPETGIQTRALRLMSALEDHDDVQNVYANFSPTAEAVAGLEEK
ncbi:MAG TPA: YebC/PmpR family DNA-binding transcriptional regulator [Planctomycetes bacterium]|nr:YebC/PmpR family DNA-binding transcriptional regulator [Planctomycetota bacterium]